jgi:hypothetical protein
MPTLIAPLPPGPLAIIGDVHGEIDALDALLAHIDALPGPPRALVFVGDLVDRGPDSVAVVQRVRALAAAGRAWVIAGNHELNILLGDEKDGNGWFFGHPETVHIAALGRALPYESRLATAEEAAEIRAFLAGLPLVLERPDLRVVHAAWVAAAAARLPADGALDTLHDTFEAPIHGALGASLRAEAAAARAAWAALKDPGVVPPDALPAVQALSLAEQNDNPVKVLTSGPEAPVDRPFFTGGKWRYVERERWWDTQPPDRPTVVGHYWRRRVPGTAHGDKPDPWDTVPPFAWANGVFCVDYAVGRRYVHRHLRAAAHPGAPARPPGALGALLWPEATLLFDDGDGQTIPTENAPHR